LLCWFDQHTLDLAYDADHTGKLDRHHPPNQPHRQRTLSALPNSVPMLDAHHSCFGSGISRQRG